jgi:hypothetical protein
MSKIPKTDSIRLVHDIDNQDTSGALSIHFRPIFDSGVFLCRTER